jgi:hypothetical protein
LSLEAKKKKITRKRALSGAEASKRHQKVIAKE